MTLASDKVDGNGLSNTACHAHLAKKTKLMPYIYGHRWNPASVIEVSGWTHSYAF